MKGIRGDRGAAAVEFGVLFLLLMIIVFGIIEFGFIWLQSHYIANAAREGARVAARLENPTTSNRTKVEDAIKEYLKSLYSGDRVEGNSPYSQPAVGGCCDSGDFIEVVIADEVIDAGLGGENPPAVKVTVTVQTAKVWDPILWDLLKLINPGTAEISEISSFAIFAVEP